MTTTPTAPFIEPGEAFRRLGGYVSPAAQPRFDVIVIGGGQAGLSVGTKVNVASRAAATAYAYQRGLV